MDLEIKDELKIMACHEDGDAHCIGWLRNQIDNNNISLRISLARCDNINQIKLDGSQHSSFEQTLPKLP